eukprot:UN00347
MNPAIYKRWKCDSHFHSTHKKTVPQIFNETDNFWACPKFAQCNKCICRDCFEAEYRASVPCQMCHEKLFEETWKNTKLTGRKPCTMPDHDENSPETGHFYTCSSR